MFPALSTERLKRVVVPWVETAKGSMYAIQVVPSVLYSMRAIPETGSFAGRSVTWTSEVYQPFPPSVPLKVTAELSRTKMSGMLLPLESPDTRVSSLDWKTVNLPSLLNAGYLAYASLLLTYRNYVVPAWQSWI